ncbi:MAG TPA: MFS transporter [Chloroflexota bacterium]|nr:MFS transporter [Chloroflexota bacterium]
MATVARPLAALPNPLAGLAYHWQALVVIVLGSFMVVLDTTIVNIALPKIIQVFQSTVDEGDMVLTGYMLALAVVMPATGYLSDRFGAKRTYMVTVILSWLGVVRPGAEHGRPGDLPHLAGAGRRHGAAARHEHPLPGGAA